MNFKVRVSTLERKEGVRYVKVTGRMKDMNIKVRKEGECCARKDDRKDERHEYQSKKGEEECYARKDDRKDERHEFQSKRKHFIKEGGCRYVRVTGRMKDMNFQVRVKTLERKVSVMHVMSTGRMKDMNFKVRV